MIYISLDHVVLRDKIGEITKRQVNIRQGRTNQNKTWHYDTRQTATMQDTIR